MKVLQIIEALTRGGAERLVIELSREYVKRGVDAQVLCLSAPGPWAADIEGDGLYAGCLGKRPGIDLGIIGKLKNRIAELAPDVVHTHLFTSNLWVRLASLPRRNWRLVSTLHDLDTWRGPVHTFADWVLKDVADFYVGVSGAVRDYYAECGVSAKKLAVIPNGIYSNGETPAPILDSKPAVVRACGRLVAKKGFLVLINAAALLKAEGVDVSIEIVGDGPQRPELEAAIRARGVESHLRLLGARDDARRLIAETDVFVLPSFIEGLPLVILEAFHAGRPVVTTDLPGLRGVVTHGEDAIVVRPGDAEALARGIRMLVENPDVARALARVARAKAKQEFSIERTAASYLQLYNQLTEARPA